MASAQITYRIGTDIGGTFTDLVLLGSDGSFRIKKVLSTPPDFETAVVTGVAALMRREEPRRLAVSGLLLGAGRPGELRFPPPCNDREAGPVDREPAENTLNRCFTTNPARSKSKS